MFAEDTKNVWVISTRQFYKTFWIIQGVGLANDITSKCNIRWLIKTKRTNPE